MTPRQSAILDYHSDLAAFATNPKHSVFVILDLEDSVALEIASHFQANCADKRDAIRDTGAYPVFTLALPLKDANAMLAHGWPNAKKIEAISEGMIPVILVSAERCLTVLLPRE